MFGRIFGRFDKRFASQVKRQKKSLTLGLLCSFMASGIELASVAFIFYTFNALDRGDSRFLSYLCLAVVPTYFLKYGFTFGQTYFISRAAQGLTADLRVQLFEKLQSLPMAFFNTQRVGALQSVVTNDVTVVQAGITGIRDLINGPIMVVGGIATLFLLNWKLTLISLIALPPIIIALRVTSRRVRKAQDQVQGELAQMQSVMQESLNSVRIVKSFAAESRETGRFAAQVARTFESNLRLVRRVASLKPLIELIGAFALAGTLWVGGLLVTGEQMTVAALITFGFTLDKIKNGATGLGNLSNNFSQVFAATDRIYREVLDVESEITDVDGALTIQKPAGRIEFRNVSFTYPDGTEALRNVSFVIEPGTSTALVGRSGAGKSTITDLILRFYDTTAGEILFDGINIKDLQQEWLRRQMGVVPQQTSLFACSIRDNIAFGNPGADDVEIRAAACTAHADEFINQMPERYETILNERGVKLSGGEMQRIAIARALVMNPVLLLLDEATSALDAVSERHVQEALDQIMHERTTLIVAHRLNTAARTDQIIVLSNGEIVEIGSHQSLLELSGTYAGMYRAFSAGVFDGSLG